MSINYENPPAQILPRSDWLHQVMLDAGLHDGGASSLPGPWAKYPNLVSRQAYAQMVDYANSVLTVGDFTWEFTKATDTDGKYQVWARVIDPYDHPTGKLETSRWEMDNAK